MISTRAKWRRLEAAFGGSKPDRVPFGIWRHFPEIDLDPVHLGVEHVAFFRRYDLDYLKVMFRSSFGVEDWGCTFGRYNPEVGNRVAAAYAVRTPEDWFRLERLPPDRGVLGEQLRVLEVIRDGVRGEAPILATVFAPSMIASRLAGEETFLRHLREAPGAVAAGLETIAQTVADFGGACLHGVADGVFYSINLASREILSEAEYARLATLYDLPVAQSLHAKSRFTMLHMHGSAIMFEELARFPAHALNWYDRSGPSLRSARAQEERAFAGGIDHERTLLTGTPERVTAEVAEAIAQVDARGILIAPGCSIPIAVPHENLLAVRAALDAN